MEALSPAARPGVATVTETAGDSRQDSLYHEAAAAYGPALERLARAYEANPDQRLDLLQNIRLQLWTSLALFDGRCSLRTWVYRVAHNVAASHVSGSLRRGRAALVGLQELEERALREDVEGSLDRRRSLERLLELIHTLRPPDRQVMLLYLEGHTAASIGEITGLSPGNVATKVHRIQRLLARRIQERVEP
jgi:RNA polymerase sigma-70 factor (ECF subfamily)